MQTTKRRHFRSTLLRSLKQDTEDELRTIKIIIDYLPTSIINSLEYAKSANSMHQSKRLKLLFALSFHK